MVNESPFDLSNRARIILSIVLFILTIPIVLGVLPFIHSYYSKMLVTCLLLFFAGLLGGFKPVSGDPQLRRVFNKSGLIMSVALSMSLSAQIANLYHYPADQGYPLLLKPVFLVPFILIILSAVVGDLLGKRLYQKLHPDLAFLPFEPEETDESNEAIWKEYNRSSRNQTLIIFTIGVLAIIIGLVFKTHFIKIVMSSTALLAAYMSFTFGYDWRKSDREAKRFGLILACIGPPAGFVGVYFAKTQDTAHLILGLKFAACLACILFIPAWIGMYIERYRCKNSGSLG